MSTMRFTAAALIAMTSCAAAALAQNPPDKAAFCRSYAANVAGMGDMAIKRNPACLDYSKGVHGVYTMHYDWCMKTPPASVKGAEANIRRLVSACTAGASPPPAGAPRPPAGGGANAGGGRFIVNNLSGKCIDVSGAPGTANGSELILWPCETSGRSTNGAETDHRWQMLPNGLIRNKLSGKCIDVQGQPGTVDGSRLQISTCETSGLSPNGAQSDQQWQMLPNGLIRNKASGKCIDVSGEPGTADGTRLLLWPCEASGHSPSGAQTDQVWRLQ